MKAIYMIWVLAALCYLVPYLLLTHINAWYGSFLFWTVAGICVILLNFIATRHFSNHDKQP